MLPLYNNNMKIKKLKTQKRKNSVQAGGWWLTSVIPAIQRAEIRRIVVQSQPRQIVLKTKSQKNPYQKRAGGVSGSSGRAPALQV
jgi:hypothetical protein